MQDVKLIIILMITIRGLIQVGVNVAASSGTPGKKNRPSRPRGGPVQPVRLHWCTNLSNVTPLCFAYNSHQLLVEQKSSILPRRCGL